MDADMAVLNYEAKVYKVMHTINANIYRGHTSSTFPRAILSPAFLGSHKRCFTRHLSVQFLEQGFWNKISTKCPSAMSNLQREKGNDLESQRSHGRDQSAKGAAPEVISLPQFINTRS